MKVSIDQAINLLEQGEVVALPTDTVYGLAARFDSKEAIEKIYQLKKREKKKPLVVMLHQSQDLFSYIDQKNIQKITPSVDQLIESYWPGALTLVLPVEENAVIKEARSHLPSCGFRVANHPTIEQVTKPLALVVTSANFSKEPPLKTQEAIEEVFGRDFPVVEGEVLQKPVSTVVAYSDQGWNVIRESSIPKEVFTKA